MGTGNRQERTAEEREQARLEREARRGRAVASATSEIAQPDVEPEPPGVESEPLDVEPGPPDVEPQPLDVEPLDVEPVLSDFEPVPADTLVPATVASVPRGPEIGRASAERVVEGELEQASVERPSEAELGQASTERSPELALRPIPVKLPRPAPLPPRLPPPRVPAPKSGRWGARLRVGALLMAVVAVLGGLVALFVHVHSKASAKPPAPIAVVSVTIPEGETAAQIAQIAAAKGLTGSYLRAASKAARHSVLLDPTDYGAPRANRSLEGFLFPATYEMYAGAPARQLLAKQLTAFGENFGSVQERRARALHVTPYQLLIVASMVEREALLARDRPRVAAVIYNRLRLGMALGIDSTIRYALHDFSKPLTEAQLHIDSPYNTRIHHGLPPTPISNPGLAAIDAAAHPAHVPYLYYVNGADGCGELVFSTSYAEFERNATAYQQALAKHGGRVPSCPKR
jgi:cell division protein YceG involved in septum cleavage